MLTLLLSFWSRIYSACAQEAMNTRTSGIFRYLWSRSLRAFKLRIAVLFQGGVASNPGVVRALREQLGFGEKELRVANDVGSEIASLGFTLLCGGLGGGVLAFLSSA